MSEFPSPLPDCCYLCDQQVAEGPAHLVTPILVEPAETPTIKASPVVVHQECLEAARHCNRVTFHYAPRTFPIQMENLECRLDFSGASFESAIRRISESIRVDARDMGPPAPESNLSSIGPQFKYRWEDLHTPNRKLLPVPREPKENP